MIIAIVLLSIWAVLATITAIDNENRRSRLYDECEQLEAKCEDQEKAYNKLKKDYDDLEKDRDKWEDKYLDSNAYYTFHLAYEWLFDMLANSNNPNYNADAALDEICEREGLGLLSKSYVLKEAQKIMQEYEIEIE